MAQRFVTYQTVRIKRGAHGSPDQGACVMELASMLAGERFSDRPRAVCPVIAAFLRTYNDALNDEQRQDLYPIASAVVGTATSDEDVIAARVHLIAEWARAQLADRPRRRFLLGPRHVWVDESHGREVGIRAVIAVRRIDQAVHASALTLIAQLIAADRSRVATACAPDASERATVTGGT